MMIDPLAIDRQRQQEAGIRRCLAHAHVKQPQPAKAHEHRRRSGVFRRRLSATASF
jgi:hypothetical protein